MISVSIIGVLAATAIPTYSIFVKQARLLSAEVTLVNALKDFTISKEYSPASGMLADLVVEGYLPAIPNDPWTDLSSGPATGAGEAVDWYYENDGNQLYLYANSHPGRLYTLPSLGSLLLAQVSGPPSDGSTAGGTAPPDAGAALPSSVKEAKKIAKQLNKNAKAKAKKLRKDAKAAGKRKSKAEAKQLIKNAKAAGNQLRKDAKAAGNQLVKDTRNSLSR